MDDAGKLESAMKMANYLQTIGIPQEVPNLEKGLRALHAVHFNANELVVHNGKKLNDVILEKDVLRTYVLAMQVELSEFLQTLDWKPWRDAPAKSREATLDEFADILAFLGVLITILHAQGYGIWEIAKVYGRKEGENINRFIRKMEADCAKTQPNTDF